MTPHHAYHGDAFGIYVHWPFCAAKCPYCDFNSHLRPNMQRNSEDELNFARALARELKFMAEDMHNINPPQVSTIFFGGGTPSLMSAQAVDIVLNQIAALWTIEPDAEISLEANPTSADAENFRAYAQSGINRLSLGIQSLNDKTLQFLGRKHNAKEARKALETARKYYPRISFDLIYAHPEQTETSWKTELTHALSLNPQHISLYQLTIEPETPFERFLQRGDFTMPDCNHAVRLYEKTNAVCAEHGLNNYEISNYAKPHHECRHNLIYWHYGDYLGVGPGAHSRLTKSGQKSSKIQKRAIIMRKHPEKWYDNIQKQGHAKEHDTILSPKEQGEEMILMGLRLTSGIHIRRWQERCGQKWAHDRTKDLIEHNLLRTDKSGDYIRTTPKGKHVLNAIIAHLCT